MKKILIILLLNIITAAMLTPCCIYDDCPADQTSSQQNNKEKSDGSCSPFFSCSTCSGFTWNSKQVQIAEPATASMKHHEQFSTEYIQTIYTSFWQPPRYI